MFRIINRYISVLKKFLLGEFIEIESKSLDLKIFSDSTSRSFVIDNYNLTVHISSENNIIIVIRKGYAEKALMGFDYAPMLDGTIKDNPNGGSIILGTISPSIASKIVMLIMFIWISVFSMICISIIVLAIITFDTEYDFYIVGAVCLFINYLLATLQMYILRFYLFQCEVLKKFLVYGGEKDEWRS